MRILKKKRQEERSFFEELRDALVSLGDKELADVLDDPQKIINVIFNRYDIKNAAFIPKQKDLELAVLSVLIAFRTDICTGGKLSKEDVAEIIMFSAQILGLAFIIGFDYCWQHTARPPGRKH